MYIEFKSHMGCRAFNVGRRSDGRRSDGEGRGMGWDMDCIDCVRCVGCVPTN